MQRLTQLTIMLLYRIVLSLVLLSGMGQSVLAAEHVLLMIYKERDAGGGAFISRMIVNNNFMRLDYGPEEKDFVLFNRQTQIINSISSTSRTVMVINHKKIFVKPPFEIKSTSKQISANRVNIRNSTKMLHLRFFANESRCLDSFIVPNLVPSATRALQEYYAVLAGEHAKTIHLIPAEFIDACDLAMNIFFSGKRFDSGFPIREMIMNGKERILLDYDENYKIDEQWRRLPLDYKRYSPSQMRGDEMDTQTDTATKHAQF